VPFVNSFPYTRVAERRAARHGSKRVHTGRDDPSRHIVSRTSTIEMLAQSALIGPNKRKRNGWSVHVVRTSWDGDGCQPQPQSCAAAHGLCERGREMDTIWCSNIRAAWPQHFSTADDVASTMARSAQKNTLDRDIRRVSPVHSSRCVSWAGTRREGVVSHLIGADGTGTFVQIVDPLSRVVDLLAMR
jgi:hypothetical protein